MKTAFVLASAWAATASAASVTPVQKVIQLLEGMAAKGKDEKQAEAVQYASYKQFCDDTGVEKKRLITEATEQIDRLNADIEKYTAHAAKLTSEIAAHDEDISVWTGDTKAATKVRDIEKADYTTTHQDYSESIDALGRAIAVLKKQAHDRPQSLLQVESLNGLKLIPDDAKRSINAFLSEDSLSLSDVAPPEASGYEFQSHGIIEMLEKLNDKFIAERTQLEKEEMNAKQAFEMLIQDLTAQIQQATSERDSKSKTKAAKLEAKAQAEGDVEDTTAARAADTKYLSDLEATCAQKADDFASRQQLRAEEIEAIEKAIEIISSGAVSGSADKHLPAMLQVSKGTALAQLRTSTQERASLDRVARFLQAQGEKLDSSVLSALALKAASDPFVKVRKMIKDLITRLMEEAGDEADHKGWCDTELGTNEQIRKEKTDVVETLHSTIDQLEASIAKLTEELAELAQAIADLDAAMAKATTLRQEEKTTNTATTKDAQEAQTAVAQALTVLKDFYAKAGEATAFVQQTPPESFDAPYQGMQSENGGVVGMLEVIQSDFARLEADTKASEATAQKEYEGFMSDSKVDKEAKEVDIEHKTAKKQDENQALTVNKEDLAGTQKELEAALGYFDKLKPSCIESGVSYDDRVERRKEEIESLQNALKILNGEEI
jgi:prefoldin subunit 5